MKPLVVAAAIVALLATGALAGDWVETVTLEGDLRYRHEMIDQDGEDVRNRQRMRARIALSAKPEDNLELGFRLASGGDDPISTNQTLDDAFASKSIVLDQAFFAWTHAASGAKATGGKFATPFHRPGKVQMLWDDDLSTEGLAVNHVFGEGATTYFVNGAGLWIDERSSDANSALYGVQAGLKRKSDSVWFVVGGGYFNYTKLAGAVRDGDFFGNSTVVVGVDGRGKDILNYANDFNLVELFAEIGFAAGETPVALFVDFVTNREAEADEQAYLIGAKLGKTKKPGSWELKYDYREVQKDAVFGVFTESDFRGGGSDGKGHKLGFGYQLTGKSKFALTYYVNERGVDNGVDYNRFQADMKFKF